MQSLDRRRHAREIGPLGKLTSGDDRDDAFGAARRGAIDRGDPGMGMGRADKMSMQATRKDDVVEIAALPGDEPVIFLAQQRCSDRPGAGHVAVSSRRRAAALAMAATMLW